MAESAVKFLNEVWTKQILLPMATTFLEGQSEDFYSRIHRDIRKKFALFATAVYDDAVDGGVELAVRELTRLQKYEIYSADVFLVFADLLVRNSELVDRAVVTEIVDDFIAKCDDLLVFGFDQRIVNVDAEISERWIRKLIVLVIAQFNPEIKETWTDPILMRLGTAHRFLESIGASASKQPSEKYAGIVAQLKASQSEKIQAVGNVLEYFLPFVGDES
jgi:hypothetical protein